MVFGVVVAIVLIIAIFIDTFETMLLARRVRHSYRLARVYFTYGWILWGLAAGMFPRGRLRLGFLSIFGPLSFFGLVLIWAAGLIFGFALLHWSLDTPLSFAHEGDNEFFSYLYFSGTTFFTLGYGDLVPTKVLGRTLGIVESGIGFGFLALVISYLPVLYQSFSRREITISMLDARAGSPPTAGEFLRRLGEAKALSRAEGLLAEWERWAAELLESHLSYPVLSYYRSQHDNQSWVSTLTMMLDTSSLLIGALEGSDGYQPRLTFAMARHAAVDLGLVFNKPPIPSSSSRLPPEDLARLVKQLRESGLTLRDDKTIERNLAELRAVYEPFVLALSVHFHFDLPAFLPKVATVDNWRTSPWMAPSPDLSGLRPAPADEHYH